MKGKQLTVAILLLLMGASGVYWLRLRSAPQPAAAVAARKAPPPVPPAASQTTKLPTIEEVLKGPSLEAMRLIQARFVAGDYGAALDLADRYMDDRNLSPEFHTWLRDQMPALLISAGWIRIKLGDCDIGGMLLRRAEAIRRSEETAKGLAYCYYKQKNLPGADEQFTAYLQLKPDDSSMQALYADLLESDHRYNDAIKALEKIPGDNPDVKARLTSMRARAQESVNQVTTATSHINLTYRVEDHEALVPTILDTLESSIDEFVERLGFKEPQTQIEVILYPQSSFHSVVAGSPDWAQGIFDGRMRIPIGNDYLAANGQAALARLLRHELVHAMLALMTDSRALPPWFNEGLAQRLECKASEACLADFPPRQGDFLAPTSFNQPYTAYEALLAERSYRQSLYLINTLEFMKEGEDPLRKVVETLNHTSNVSSDGLLSPLKLTFDELHTAAAGYWKNKTRFARN